MIRMTMRVLLTFILPIGLLAMPLLGVSSTALAAKPKPTPPGHHLNITEVFVDLAMGELTINGEDFTFGPGPLVVTLGEFAPLHIDFSNDIKIIVDLPDGIVVAITCSPCPPATGRVRMMSMI